MLNKEPDMAYIFVKHIHIVGIMVFVSSLVLEHMLIKPKMSPAEVGKVAIVDAVYGASATIVLIAGLVLWFFVGKGSDFYTSNPVFHTKVAIFVLAALLSIYPTIFFIKNRKSTLQAVSIPKSIVLIVRLELLMVLLLPLFAVLMAQGYGLA
jgi:putative membrane protein